MLRLSEVATLVWGLQVVRCGGQLSGAMRHN